MKNIILVNTFTFIRLIGVLFIFPIYVSYGTFVTGVYLIFIYATDKVDGFLAHRLNSCTFFGSMLDSLSDKILNGVVCIALFNITKLSIIPLIFEILIFLLSLLRFKFNQSMKTNNIGRTKMVVLAVTFILSFLLSDSLCSNDYLILFMPLLVMEIFTFLSYLINFLKREKKLQKNIIEKRKNVKNKLFDPEFYEINKDLSYAEAIGK